MASNKVYVGNLSYNTTHDSLLQAFSRSGAVTEAIVMTDRETGRSRGFGFVSFSSEDQALKAIQDWNNQELDGRRIAVNEAQDRRPASNGFDSRPNQGAPRFNTSAVVSERFGNARPNQSNAPRPSQANIYHNPVSQDRFSSGKNDDSRSYGRPARDRGRKNRRDDY